MHKPPRLRAALLCTGFANDQHVVSIDNPVRLSWMDYQLQFGADQVVDPGYLRGLLCFVGGMCCAYEDTTAILAPIYP